MQTNKKTISDEMFDTANAISDVSRTANLYGRLFAIKEMQIHLLQEENKIKANLKTLEKKEKENE
jgi:hypothetical protein